MHKHNLLLQALRQHVLAFVPASSGLDHTDSIAFKGVLRTVHPCCLVSKASGVWIRLTRGTGLQGLLNTRGVSQGEGSL